MARELGEALPGTIVTTAGGCAAHLASVLGRERVKELSQWLVERGDGASAEPAEGRPRIGLQDSCHLRNGLGIWREPRELIARVGEYVELPSAAACCGAAGSYSIVRPEDSARVLDRHLDEIADADLDLSRSSTRAATGSSNRASSAAGSERASSTSPNCWPARNDAPTPGGTVVLHTGVGILADEGAGAACWAV